MFLVEILVDFVGAHGILTCIVDFLLYFILYGSDVLDPYLPLLFSFFYLCSCHHLFLCLLCLFHFNLFLGLSHLFHIVHNLAWMAIVCGCTSGSLSHEKFPATRMSKIQEGCVVR